MQHEIKTNGQRKTVLAYFDSIQEGFRHREEMLTDPRMHQEHKDEMTKHGERHNQHRTGCSSPEEFATRVKYGWSEGADRMMKIAMREFNPVSTRRRRVRADQGDALDIHAVYRGDLSRAWERTRRLSRSGAGRAITLACDIGANAGTESEELFWRGASVLRLSEALETAGYAVRIVAGFGGINSDIKNRVSQGTIYEIKASDQPLDVTNLAAIIGLAGYFRVVGFSAIVDACHRTGQIACTTLGSNDASKFEEALKHFIPDDNLIIQPENVLSKDTAEKWIASVLEQIEQPMPLAA